MTREAIGVILLAMSILGSRSIQGQSTDTENVKIVTTGEVRKIDDKEKTFQFKFKLDHHRLTIGRSCRQLAGAVDGGVGEWVTREETGRRFLRPPTKPKK